MYASEACGGYEAVSKAVKWNPSTLVRFAIQSRAPRRLRRIMSRRAVSKTRQPKCGTYGCMLNDRHPGLHSFVCDPWPRAKRRKPAQTAVARTELVANESSPGVGSPNGAKVGSQAEVLQWFDDGCGGGWQEGGGSEERGDERVVFDDAQQMQTILKAEADQARAWATRRDVGVSDSKYFVKAVRDEDELQESVRRRMRLRLGLPCDLPYDQRCAPCGSAEEGEAVAPAAAPPPDVVDLRTSSDEEEVEVDDVEDEDEDEELKAFPWVWEIEFGRRVDTPTTPVDMALALQLASGSLGVSP